MANKFDLIWLVQHRPTT